MTAATPPAPEPRVAPGDIADATAAPVPPLMNLWGWPGARPGPPHVTHADLRVRLVWLAAAVLAIVGLLLWQW